MLESLLSLESNSGSAPVLPGFRCRGRQVQESRGPPRGSREARRNAGRARDGIHIQCTCARGVDPRVSSLSLANKHAAAELGVSEVTARLGLEKGPGSPKLKLRRNNPTEYLSTFRLRPPRVAYVLSPDMGSLLRRTNDSVAPSKLNRGILPAESGR
jgi:hypothetical protein